MLELVYKFDINQIQNKRCFRLLPNGDVIFFGKGLYDDFCTYIGHPVWSDTDKTFVTMCGTVTDAVYFDMCKTLCDRYGTDLIYRRHLTGLYNRVGNFVDKTVIEAISNAVSVFHNEDDRNMAVIAYTLIYYGMVAEENHRSGSNPNSRPICGKVIKMAGLYKHLIENVPLGTQSNPGACHCYVGMNPNDILKDAAAYGIFRDVAVYFL